MVELFANSGDPDQTPRSAASDLGRHYLPITLLGVFRLQWVKKSRSVRKRTFGHVRQAKIKIKISLRIHADQNLHWSYYGQPWIQSFILRTMNSHNITKTCLYNFDPLKPHFYIVKLGFTGVYVIVLISAQNIDCRGGSNEYPQAMFWAEIRKISELFIWTFSFFWW